MRPNLFMVRWNALDVPSRCFSEDIEQPIRTFVFQDGLECTSMVNKGRVLWKKEHGCG